MKDSLGKTIPKNAFIIRHTELSDFRNCKRKWFIGTHNGLNLEPVFSDPRLKFGTAWHWMLEQYYYYISLADKNKIKSLDDVVAAMSKEFEECLREEFNEFDTAIAVSGVPVEDSTFTDAYDEMLALGLSLIPEYIEWSNSLDCSPRDDELEVIMLEQRLVVPIPGTKCYLSAKIDGLVKFGSAYYILEHKTRSKSSSVTNPGEIQLDIQLGVQQWVARQALPQYNIVGSIYNLARKQKPSSKVKAPLFGRHLTYRSSYELDHLIDSIKRGDYPDMKRCGRDRSFINWNPQPIGICGWGCKATKACASTNRGEDVDYILNTFFKPRDKTIWEVLEDEME